MLKKFYALLALAMFIAVSSTDAVLDNVVTDHYKISFDMGLNHSDYNVTVNAPITTESLDGTENTYYEVLIISLNRGSLP
jgi:hypothetical protein